MVEYLKIFVNDSENYSFYAEIELLEEHGNTYLVEKGTGNCGTFVTWVDPKYNVEPGVVRGKIEGVSTLSPLLKYLVSPFNKGQKRFPENFKKSECVMGSLPDEFTLDYRMADNVRTHHIYGKASQMPEEIKEIIRVFVQVGVFEERVLKFMGEDH